MATVTGAAAINSSSNVTSYSTSTSFTPAAGDLLVAFMGVTGETSTDWAVNDSQGGTWTKVLRALKNSSADFLEFWVRDTPASNVSHTATFSHPSGNATGCQGAIMKVAGMSLYGPTAVLQTAKQDNQAAGTPAPVFSSSVLTTNPTVAAEYQSANAGMTAPTGWTENNDTGTGPSPNVELECIRRNSGFTGTTLTFGSSTSGDFAAIAVELDSATTSATATPSTVVGVGAIPSPAPFGLATATPAVVAGIGSVPTVVVLTDGDIAAAPATVHGVGAVPSPIVDIGDESSTEPAFQGDAFQDEDLAFQTLGVDTGGGTGPHFGAILVRAPGRIGRIFHEFSSKSGEIFHPSVVDWEATETAPGGFGPATGRIAARAFRAHREVFEQGCVWRTYLESDGTVLHAGELLPPDGSEGEVQLNDRGWAYLAEREFGRIIYQEAGPGGWSSIDTPPFTDETANSTGFDHHFTPNLGNMLSWKFHKHGDTASGLGMPAAFYAPGQQLTRVRFNLHLDGNSGNVDIVVQALNHTDVPGSGFGPFGSTDGAVYNSHLAIPTIADIDVDFLSPTPPVNASFPTTGGGARIPCELISIFPHIGIGADPVNVLVEITDIRVNGVAPSDVFTASDLVTDIISRIGLHFARIEPTGQNILPYTLEQGSTAAEALDWACVLTGNRYLFEDSGDRPTFEFSDWSERNWVVTSPWALYDVVPMERFDKVIVPFVYSDGVSYGEKGVRLVDSPLERTNSYGFLDISPRQRDEESPKVIAQRVLETLSKVRHGGNFSMTEVLGDEGHVSAHHVRAGGVLAHHGQQFHGPLRIGSIRRTEDRVEGEFLGGHPGLERYIARRENRARRREAVRA